MSKPLLSWRLQTFHIQTPDSTNGPFWFKSWSSSSLSFLTLKIQWLDTVSDQLSHLSTSRNPTYNLSHYQLTAWASNCSQVQCSHPVFKMIPLIFIFILCWKYIETRNKLIIINEYEINEMNQNIILILAIYITYLSKWCTIISNNYPVMFLKEYIR